MQGKITQVDDMGDSTWWIHIKVEAQGGLFGKLLINNFIYIVHDEPDVQIGQAVEIDVRPVYEGTVDEIAAKYEEDCDG